MSKTTANISIDSDIKAKAQALFAELGMDLSTAINVFLRQAIRENAIPFAVTSDVPNEITLAAMRETEEMHKHPENYKGYQDVDQMMEELLGEL